MENILIQNNDMENKKDLKTTVDEFLEEENKELEDKKIVQEKCQTEECRIKNKDSIIERVNKVFITSDGRQLLNG